MHMPYVLYFKIYKRKKNPICATFLPPKIFLKQFNLPIALYLSWWKSDLQKLECLRNRMYPLWTHVAETNRSFDKHTYMFEIYHGGQKLLYKHSNSSDHSILSIKVRIIDNIYHHTNGTLSKPFRRQREEHWIRKQGTLHMSAATTLDAYEMSPVHSEEM
jgi:hypothetical protein